MARRTKKTAAGPGVSTPSPDSPSKKGEKSHSDKHQRNSQKDESSSNNRTRLYDLLRIKPEATQIEITKSYRALALLLHPDKVAQKLQQEESTAEGEKKKKKGGKSFEELKEEATRHFQELQAAYEVLKDPKRRKIYDETGSTGETSGETYEEAYAYYRRVYPEFDVADIEKYREKYLESEEEIQDILDFCIKFDGDLTHFFEYIPFSEKEHLSRYLNILDDLVKSKKVKKTKKFESTLQQMEAQAEKLAALTEKESKKSQQQQQSKKKSSKKNANGDEGLADLVLAIQANRAKRAQRAQDLFARIEAKYGAMDEEEADSDEGRQKNGKNKKRRKN
ncbi:hypothetical protein CSUI_005890 [Cystoisospora suis]|uniref:J domain-containing protein n=1 Tax=Cystoisospora suis TaxID=483139 RepID=A0A2C6KWD1_9APIC|nr:hypothetical protein CSUI_005890 [Cystoisospora suis]